MLNSNTWKRLTVCKRKINSKLNYLYEIEINDWVASSLLQIIMLKARLLGRYLSGFSPQLKLYFQRSDPFYSFFMAFVTLSNILSILSLLSNFAGLYRWPFCCQSTSWLHFLSRCCLLLLSLLLLLQQQHHHHHHHGWVLFISELLVSNWIVVRNLGFMFIYLERQFLSMLCLSSILEYDQLC